MFLRLVPLIAVALLAAFSVAAWFMPPMVAWARDGAPAGAGPSVGPEPVDPELARRLLEDSRARGRVRETESARRARERSRHAFAGRSDGGAVQVARDQFPEAVGGDVSSPLVARAGERVRYTGRHSALLTPAGGGPGVVVESEVPLQAGSDDEHLAPVDLELDERGGALVAVNPVVGVRVAKTLGAGVSLPGVDVAFVLGGMDPATSAQVVSGRAFFANAATDTDAWVAATPVGVESFAQLRSADSPQDLSMRFTLPAGARLRALDDGSGAVEIVLEAKRLALVSAPTAVDAEGEAVPASVEVRGQTLVVHVAHRDADVAYPILVDPAVTESAAFADQNAGAGTEGGGGLGWVDDYNRDFFSGFYNGPYGGELHTATYTDHDYGMYGGNEYNSFTFTLARLYPQPRPGVTLPRVDFQWGHIANNSCAYMGVRDDPRADWTSAHLVDCRASGSVGPRWDTTCVAAGCDLAGGIARSHAAFGMYLGGYTRGYAANADLYRANVFLGSDPAPTIQAPAMTGGPTRPWAQQDSATVSATADDTGTPVGSNAGIGIGRMTVSAPGSSGWAGRSSSTPSCDGTHFRPCDLTLPASFTVSTTEPGLAAAEGRIPIQATATDYIGKPTSTPTTLGTFQIDRTPPTLNTPSGSLWDRRNRVDDHRDEGLYDESYAITVTARDGDTSSAANERSGVRDIRFQLVNASGQVARDSADPSPQSCASSCPKTRSWTLDTDSVADGEYAVRVTARDQLGQASTTSFPVTIDRRGDVYTATEYQGDPTAGGEELATERHVVGTTLARREEDGVIATRRTVRCATQDCDEVRELITTADTDEPAAQQLTVTRGTSANDTRLDDVAAIREPATEDLGEPASTGNLTDALRPWQTAPPAHGATFARYDETETADVDDQDVSVVRSLYLDAATKLPLRVIERVDQEIVSEIFYSYRRQRLERGELPADTFAVERTDPNGKTSQEDLASAPQPEEESENGDLSGSETDVSLQYALAWRQAHALNTDASFVQTTLDGKTAPTYHRSMAEYGLPLTAEELTELDERDRAADAIVSVIDVYGREQASDSYAGAWIDQRNDGVVRVGFTKDTARHMDALKAKFPFPGRLRSFDAKLTVTELNALFERMENDVDALEGESIVLNTLYPDIRDNTVKAGVSIPSPLVELQLRARYGIDRIVLEKEDQFADASSRLRSARKIPPVNGGLKIKRSEVSCSTAFSVRRGRKRRVLTAGHCGPRGGSWRHYVARRGDRRVGVATASETGTTHRDSEGKRRSIDVSQIRVRAGYVTNLLYVYPGAKNAFRRMRHQAGSDENPSGKTICVVGYRATPPRCGDLVTTHGMTRGAQGPLYRFGLMEIPQNDGGLRPGDSGGAVYRRNTAFGVLKGLNTNGTRVIFTPMTNITSRFRTQLVGG